MAFGFIGKAFKKATRIAKGVAQVAATPAVVIAKSSVSIAQGKPVAESLGAAVAGQGRAALRVASTVREVARPLQSIPIVGTAYGIQESVWNLTGGNISQLAVDAGSGVRLDRALGRTVKRGAQAADMLVPHAQAALSFVPGVGSGLSGALGAAHALAKGKGVDDALIAAAAGVIPGGPLAQAAFMAAASVAQGKPIDTVVLAALPVSPAEKLALAKSLTVVKAVATGGRVDTALYNAAAQSLQSAAGQALQQGVAFGQAAVLSKAQGLAAPLGRPLASAGEAMAVLSAAHRPQVDQFIPASAGNMFGQLQAAQTQAQRRLASMHAALPSRAIGMSHAVRGFR